MNPQNARFPVVDEALEELSRLAVPADVEQRLEARLQEFSRQPQPQAQCVTPCAAATRFSTFRSGVGGHRSGGDGVGRFVPGLQQSGRRGAGDEALRAKPWVRWTFQIPKEVPVPEGFQAPECWLSAEKKVFAGRANQSAHYIDLAVQESYDYMPQTKTVHRSLTSDIETVEVGHFETLLRLVSEGDSVLKLPESPVQIVGDMRRDVADGGHRWTEYTFACRDSRRTPQDYQVTFRVDRTTQLPVEMRSTEKFASNDPTDERIYAIDYPETGPSDIYALGVPAMRRLSIDAVPGSKPARTSRNSWRCTSGPAASLWSRLR